MNIENDLCDITENYFFMVIHTCLHSCWCSLQTENQYSERYLLKIVSIILEHHFKWKRDIHVPRKRRSQETFKQCSVQCNEMRLATIFHGYIDCWHHTLRSRQSSTDTLLKVIPIHDPVSEPSFLKAGFKILYRTWIHTNIEVSIPEFCFQINWLYIPFFSVFQNVFGSLLNFVIHPFHCRSPTCRLLLLISGVKEPSSLLYSYLDIV